MLIFDWDIHHGDGTQNIFYESNRVFYMSLHRFDNMTFFPRREDSRSNYVGAGDGLGFNVNVAWETGKIANEEVREDNERTELGCNEYRYACD